MAHQVPVVSTRIMGIPELVDNESTGLLVAPGRVDHLVDALTRLLGDADLRRRLGTAGREKVLTEFDVNRSAGKLRDILIASVP
jgi:glycosyltransferase involved in cell wall biosynthesis